MSIGKNARIGGEDSRNLLHPLVVSQNHVDHVYATFLGIGVHHTG